MAKKRTIRAIRKKEELTRAVMLSHSSYHIGTKLEDNFLNMLHIEKNKDFFKNNNIPEPVIKIFDCALFYVFDTVDDAMAFRLFLDDDRLRSIEQKITGIIDDHKHAIDCYEKDIKSMKRCVNWWLILNGKNDE